MYIMKNLKYYFIACTASLALITGCNNADYDVIDNAIYLEEPSLAASNNVKLTVDGETTTAVTVRLGQAIGEDITGTIEIDPAILQEYNEKHFTTYEVLPEKYLSYNEDFEIKAGEAAAPTTTFSIKNYPNDNGELYAIPIRLNVTKGAVSTIGESDHYIVLLDKALIQSVPFMNTSNAAGTSTSFGLSVAEWSIETWVWMDGFQINNQAIINSGGNGTEIYIRFGDASIPFNSLQIKTMGSQVNTLTLFEKNKWYHLAITYDATGMVTIYVNGEKDVTLQTKGGMANIDGMHIVTSGTWFRDNCMMAQLRLWKKAISQTQIKANMYLGVNPANPDLIGYWRLDEGEGNLFKDSTPNHFDMTAQGTVEWRHDIKFK